jgi:hypothetical protein
MDQAPFEPSKSSRGGDTRTPQARVDIARREEQIVALRLRHIPFAAIARTVGVNKSNAIRAFNKALRRNTDQDISTHHRSELAELDAQQARGRAQSKTPHSSLGARLHRHSENPAALDSHTRPPYIARDSRAQRSSGS